MEIKKMFLQELDQEAENTRKMLQRIPDDKFEWQPHPKSMTLKRLANHIAELPGWIQMILTTKELDFAKTPYEPNDYEDTAGLISFFEECLDNGKNQLKNAEESDFHDLWALRAGDQIFTQAEKWEMIRHTFCQIVHHRAQLGVYFRLLDIPVPSTYGGSADDPNF